MSHENQDSERGSRHMSSPFSDLDNHSPQLQAHVFPAEALPATHCSRELDVFFFPSIQLIALKIEQVPFTTAVCLVVRHLSAATWNAKNPEVPTLQSSRLRAPRIQYRRWGGINMERGGVGNGWMDIFWGCGTHNLGVSPHYFGWIEFLVAICWPMVIFFCKNMTVMSREDEKLSGFFEAEFGCCHVCVQQS